MLAEMQRIYWSLICMRFCFFFLPNQERSSSEASILGRKERLALFLSGVVHMQLVDNTLIFSYSHRISLLMSGMATAEKPKLYPLRRVPRQRERMANSSLGSPGSSAENIISITYNVFLVIGRGKVHHGVFIILNDRISRTCSDSHKTQNYQRKAVIRLRIIDSKLAKDLILHKLINFS